MENEPDPIGDLRRLLKESKQQTGPPPIDVDSDWPAACWSDPMCATPLQTVRRVKQRLEQKYGDHLRRL